MSSRSKKGRISAFYLVGVLVFVGSSALIAAQHLESQRLQTRAIADLEQGRKLDSERQVLSEHCWLKRGMIDELRRGQISLADAASYCLQIDQNWPLVLRSMRRCYFGESDLEKEARCLAAIACGRPMSPDDRVMLLARLNAEFRTLFPSATDLMVPVSV